MSNEIKDLKDMERASGEPDSLDDKRGASMAWLPGLILIGVGVVLLLGNFTDFRLDNWWALFILIPAFGSLGNFWRAYRNTGRFNDEARGSFIGGIILLFIAAAFLFSWNWAYVWPFFLIIGGIGALLSARGD